MNYHSVNIDIEFAGMIVERFDEYHRQSYCRYGCGLIKHISF